MMELLGQISEGTVFALIAGVGSGGLATGLLISLVKHSNNGEIHINKRDTFMTGDKKDYVRKDTCEQKHAGDDRLTNEIKRTADFRHQELKSEIKTVRKGIAYLLSLQTGKPLPDRAGTGNQSEIFEAIVGDLNNEE